MKDIAKCSNYLYNFINIPIYQYRNHTLVNCFPEGLHIFSPPKAYLKEICSRKEAVACVRIHELIYFGYLRLDEPGSFLVLGPTCQIALPPHSIDDYCKDYVVLPEQRKEFYEYFHTLSCILPHSLWNLLLFLDSSLNEHPCQLEPAAAKVFSHKSVPKPIMVEKANSFYDLAENALFYDNVKLEQQLTSLIENGEVDKLKIFARHAHQEAHYGSVASNNLRQLKNTALILITLSSRAAIRGGLSASTAYALGDLYMRQTEQLLDSDSLLNLMQNIQIDFASHVAAVHNHQKAGFVQDSDISRAIEFIHKNVNRNISVEDVAHEVGLSRVYFSNKFSKELGFSVGSFIRRCKLEEARSLLLYTDKSIAHISSYLGYSSQSHFQNLFREQFGMTPKQCRQHR
ncbi:AraC family transcriptional regulator [Diplocloster modestus]|uniref:AraC family transcriptional regulator n=1 Tax=Diplocloster modestus TaxID=2850322 RepID=A0ABS6KED0_9FIRM|nr:AraC family transcriptional regulator [Diplocloster modestus]MBU9728885.1 AraC family transcriptional regulator [Diplocloster modestus]